MKQPKTQKRTTRSISLPEELHEHVRRKAKTLDRSVNWVINELIAKDVARNG